jgi:hypothetical protein
MMDGLTPGLTQAYLKQVDRQRALTLLELLRVVMAPHMSQSDRQGLIDELKRRATGESESPALVTIKSNAEFQRYIASLHER